MYNTLVISAEKLTCTTLTQNDDIGPQINNIIAFVCLSQQVGLGLKSSEWQVSELFYCVRLYLHAEKRRILYSYLCRFHRLCLNINGIDLQMDS